MEQQFTFKQAQWKEEKDLKKAQIDAVRYLGDCIKDAKKRNWGFVFCFRNFFSPFSNSVRM